MAYIDGNEVLFSATISSDNVQTIDIVQETGNSETAVMSQKAATDAINNVSEKIPTFTADDAGKNVSVGDDGSLVATEMPSSGGSQLYMHRITVSGSVEGGDSYATIHFCIICSQSTALGRTELETYIGYLDYEYYYPASGQTTATTYGAKWLPITGVYMLYNRIGFSLMNANGEHATATEDNVGDFSISDDIITL